MRRKILFGLISILLVGSTSFAFERAPARGSRMLVSTAGDDPQTKPGVPPGWPMLKHYDQAHIAQIALPLGGIGTGTVSLGGRGGR